MKRGRECQRKDRQDENRGKKGDDGSTKKKKNQSDKERKISKGMIILE